MKKKGVILFVVAVMAIMIYKIAVLDKPNLIDLPYDIENSSVYYESVLEEIEGKRLVERRFLERERYAIQNMNRSIEELKNESLKLSENIEIPKFGTYVLESGLKFYSDMDEVKDNVFMCYLSRDVIERTMQVYDDESGWVDYGEKKYKGLYYPHILTSQSGYSERDKIINCVYNSDFEAIYENEDEGFSDMKVSTK